MSLSNPLTAQSFDAYGLQGENINNPTSLQFGPDNRLYVSQQNGIIYAFTVIREEAPNGDISYTVTDTETIDLIQQGVPNHDDDGAENSTNIRQVTGILVTGTAQNPILYVTSSDWRIGGGGSGADKNLDTNSGVLSKLTFNGTNWDKVDLVRGLPRCEENHSTNGMALDGNILYVQSGGHANKGAPSNNFAGTSEFFLSAALLRVDLAQLNSMPVYTDPRNNAQYVYDLPTLNDPERNDISFGDPDFPYPAGHPMATATIDIGDPFGGNNSLNQAFAEPGGPVQVFSPGYRNAYDVVVTEAGSIFTFDNGPNGGWGGQPLVYQSDDTPKGIQGVGGVVFDAAAGDYITNEFSEGASSTHSDQLHYVGSTTDADGTYYGGHPVPIRAFPSRADVFSYIDLGGWALEGRYDLVNLLPGVSGYFNTSFDINDFPDDPRQGKYGTNPGNPGPGVRIFGSVSSSTNGIVEYRADNFGGALDGDLLVASFNGNIVRYELDDPAAPTGATQSNLLGGFGSQPLDVTAQDDGEIFEGTIWAATYGADNITIFEPADFLECPEPQDPEYVGTEDYDNDGYTNDDEIAAGTNYCSGGSIPNDNDGDFISDVTDDDDDEDGILDVDDEFAIDAQNGTATSLPINYSLFNNDPGTGFFGLGFTGLMTNGSTDYLDQFDLDFMSPGGAAGKMGLDAVPAGDALGNQNDQEYAFHIGIDVDANSNPFTARSVIESPFFLVNGVGTTPLAGQSQGIYIGTGDQDNYLKVVYSTGSSAGDNAYGMEVVLEDGGTVTSSTPYDIPNIENASGITIYISVDPATGTAQPAISLDNGNTIIPLGSTITLPASFLNPNDQQGLAVGMIASSGNSGVPFGASWDFFAVNENQPGVLEVSPTTLDYGQIAEGSSSNSLSFAATNLGSPTDGPISITALNFSGTSAGLFAAAANLPIDISPSNEEGISITFTPDNVLGQKNATLEIIHSGSNSPTVVTLSAEVVENLQPIFRINAGGSTISATDAGPDWEPNNSLTAGTGYTTISGTNQVSNHGTFTPHSSIPAYIDAATFAAIFDQERWDQPAAPALEFQIPLNNADYVVNLFLGNGFDGTSSAGERVYDIVIEGQLIRNDLDLITEFGGTLIGGMLSFPVTVSDGELNIVFNHVVENPLINGIEILGPPQMAQPIMVDAIPDQINEAGDLVDGLAVSASGGDPNENFTYAITGAPAGVQIESTNGQIFDIIDANAFSGGPNNDGIYTVEVTVSKPSSTPVSVTFQWTVLDPSTSTFWVDQTDDENYTGRHECSFVQAGDLFFLFGGRENAATLDVYDYSTQTWTQSRADAPAQFNHFQAVEYQGLIWVIGAFKNNNFPNETPADFIWAYDPANDEWIQGPEIPAGRKRGSTGLVVYNDKFYIIAGNTIGHNGGYVNWFDEYDPATGVWTTLTDVPRARDHFHAAIIDGKLYVAGGRLSGGPGGTFEPLIAEVDVYDFASSSWSTLPAGQNLPTPRAGTATVAFEGEVYVMGGEIADDLQGNTIDDAMPTTESFNPLTGSWTTRADMNAKRHGTQALVSGDGIHITAGSPSKGGGNIKEMEYFGTDNPQGAASTAGQISGPASANVPVGGVTTIDLTYDAGNVGVILTDFALSGPDAGDFVITIGDVDQGFLSTANPLHQLTVGYSGSSNTASAVLTVSYGVSGSLQINLNASDQPALTYRVNAGGPITTDLPSDWEEDQAATNAGTGGSAATGTPSPYVNSADGDQTFGVTTALAANTTGYPDAIFNTERYSQVANPDNMQWDFPVDNGTYVVNLLFAERWTGAQNAGVRVFDVLIEGVLELDDFDQTAVYGWNTAGVETFTVEVTDGNLDIDFILDVQNPNIKGIEILSQSGNQQNQSPVVTNPGDQFNSEGDVVNLPIVANDGDLGLQDLTYAATGLPPSLVIDPATGVISGTIDETTGGDPVFLESNGLVIIEAESRDEIPGSDDHWDVETDGSGVTFQVATTNHLGNSSNGAQIDYPIRITTTGVYRFQIKSEFSGTNSTEENDTWFRIAQASDVHFLCTQPNISSEQQLIDNINGAATNLNLFYPAGNTLGRLDHGNENPGSNGFFKIYRSGGGGNKWQASTIDNNGFPVYVYFENPGDYVIEMRERSLGHKVDRIALYHVPTYGTGVPTTTLNEGTPSAESPAGMAGAAANSPYSVTVIVTDDGTPPESGVANFMWFIDDMASATITVNPGAGIGASTFGNGSFTITNDGDVNISQVSFNLSTSVLPESVFDPVGLAGDALAKCLTAGGGNTPAELGLSVAANGGSGTDEDCVDVFTDPHDGSSGNEGYDGMVLDFTDFNTGEAFIFGVDIDPLSIKDDNTAGDAGSVSGFELIGSVVTITFENGQVLTTTLWDEGSIGGSATTVKEVIPPSAPTISMVDLITPTVTNDPNQTIAITGIPDAQVSLLQVDARLYIDAGGGGYMIDPFEANTVMAKALFTTTLDANGEGTIPVALLLTASGDAGPDGGLNHFIAVHDGDMGQVSVASNVVVVEYDPNAPDRPSVVGAAVVSETSNGTNLDVSVATTGLILPNGALNASTVNDVTVTLTEGGSTLPISTEFISVNTTGGGDAITLTALGLEFNTAYRLDITSGVEDIVGAQMLPFSFEFTTGSDPGPVGTIEFDQTEVATGAGYTCVTIGPDGKLYGLVNDGEIHRWDIAADGTLSNQQTISSLQTAEGGNRLAIHMAFDPASTAGNLVAWVSHTTFGFNGMADWGGKITQLSGDDLEMVQDYVVNLPRSTRDHVTNGVAFGPDGALYVNQGSNSAMGAADNTWGNRDERLLSAAVLRIDLGAISTPPLDVQTAEGGTYDPFAVNAPVTIYGSGVRNAYDLVWHTNGELYVPTNGSAAGGNTPATPADLSNVPQRIDGPYTGAAVPAINGVSQTQNDLLFRVEEGGYYGHPNPFRGEYVMNGGNPTAAGDPVQVNQYPEGTAVDQNYRFFAYNFENNKSPNGVIEYRSDNFGGALQGRLLVVRYSGGDDIIALTPGGPDQDIIEDETGISGFTGFNNPLDLTENLANGHIYVSEYGDNKITLLRPLDQTNVVLKGNSPLEFNGEEGIFSSTQSSTDERTMVLENAGSEVIEVSGIAFSGTDASVFSLDPAITFPLTIPVGGSQDLEVIFNPAAIGQFSASMDVSSDDPIDPLQSLPLFGLSASGLEGNSEPPLNDVVQVLGVNVDVGWTSLGNTLSASPQGEEVLVSSFRKAVGGDIEIYPVARYSPLFTLPYGYYLRSGDTPIENEVDVLTGDSPEHQALLPAQTSGSTTFDPGTDPFGFYTTSPSHTAYTEDDLNALINPSQAEHAVRTYPAKDREGNVIDDAYLICFEEASNGDYNDYVFVVRNVEPAAGDPIDPGTVLYRETFWSTNDSGNEPLAPIGWTGVNTSSGSPFANFIRSNSIGKPTGLPTVNAGNDDPGPAKAIGLLAAFSGNGPYFAFTEEYDIDLNEVTIENIKWYQGHASAALATRVAVRIGGQWYASNETFTGPALGSASNFQNADPNGAQQKDLVFSTAAADWVLLNFTPSSALSIGGAAPADLSGTVDAFGLYADGANATFRADNFEIFGSSNSGGNLNPVVDNPIPDQMATEGIAYSYMVPANTFSDPDGMIVSPLAVLADGGALPAWLMFDSGTNTFSGTPAAQDVGTLDIAVTATDDGGASVTDIFVLTVLPDGSDCSELSPLECPEVPVDVTNDFCLDWTADEGGLLDDGLGIGFTMAMVPSAPLAGDLPLDPIAPGYKPANINVANGNLTITATKGLPFKDPGQSANTNSLINGLGVGFNANQAEPYSITTEMLGLPTPGGGNNFQQAGIWFGLDEADYVKLVVIRTSNTGYRVELYVEEGEQEIDKLQTAVDVVAAGTDVILKLDVDPVNNTVTGFYSIAEDVNGMPIFIQVGGTSLAIATDFIAGVTLPDAVTGPVSFAGIHASIRNSNTPLDFSFGDFCIDVAQATAGNLSLDMSLQGRMDHSGDYQVAVYSTSDLNTPVFSYSALSADGTGLANIPDLLPVGDYKVAVKYGGYLQRVIDVTIGAGTQTAVVPQLLAGDVDGNNFINIDDYDLLAASFFAGIGNPAFNPDADFDGNDFVNIDDYDFLAGNFFVAGEEVQ
ncbi:MAG: malectin domain-containing carbohydrate-binding protein [Bacteroidota bacterium]